MVGHCPIAASLTILDDVAGLDAHGMAIRTAVGMVGHRTVAASLAIRNDIANLHARGRPALHVPTASLGLLARQPTTASHGRSAWVRLGLAGLTLAEEPSTDGLAVGTTVGMVGHRTIAASLTILDDVAGVDAHGMAIRTAIGMVGHRTVAASLAIRNDIASLHARGRHALHVPTASLGLLARQTTTASHGRSAWVRLCLARLTLAEEPSTDGLAVRTTVGMVGHRTIAASLTILDDVA